MMECVGGPLCGKTIKTDAFTVERPSLTIGGPPHHYEQAQAPWDPKVTVMLYRGQG